MSWLALLPPLTIVKAIKHMALGSWSLSHSHFPIEGHIVAIAICMGFAIGVLIGHTCPVYMPTLAQPLRYLRICRSQHSTCHRSLHTLGGHLISNAYHDAELLDRHAHSATYHQAHLSGTPGHILSPSLLAGCHTEHCQACTQCYLPPSSSARYNQVTFWPSLLAVTTWVSYCRHPTFWK